MANRPHEETINVLAIPLAGITDPDAPEVSEINAGVVLISDMTADGWQPQWTKNAILTAMMDGFDRQSVGTEAVAHTLQFARQDDSTSVRGTLARRERFYLVLVPFAGVDAAGAPNAVEVGDIVDIYDVESHGIQDVPSGANTDQQYQVQLAGKTRPHLDIVVVVDAV